MTSFCLYGLGVTGESVINYFERKNLAITYSAWDDDVSKRDLFAFHDKEEGKKRSFLQDMDTADFIIVSPGINLKKSELKKKLIENKNKIITDLDLFYLFNPKIKTIVVTGTNGKSTTCKILEHVLRKNNINVKLGGNIGKPVLDLDLKSNPIVVIEASSFQLAYSKFVKPDYAAILNITNDHLDWHGTTNNYVNSKFKIFSNQKSNNFAFLNNNFLIKKFKKNKYESKLRFVNIKKYKKVKKKINNNYLSSETNDENMSYVYSLCKILKISEKSFIKSLRSFKGLPHRHEIFYRKKNKTFINDSKATSFEPSKFALKSNRNIYWIVGGLPKIGDRFQLREIKKNIIKAYIIGNNISFFKKQIKNNVSYTISKSMKNAIDTISKDLKLIQNKQATILLSPAAASFDQFNNFEDRGHYFKKLVIKKFKNFSYAKF